MRKFSSKLLRNFYKNNCNKSGLNWTVYLNWTVLKSKSGRSKRQKLDVVLSIIPSSQMTVHFNLWPSSLARSDSDLHISTVLSDKKWVESGWNWTCLTFMFPRLALINYKLEIISQLRWDYLKWKEFSREHLTHVTWRTFWQWGHLKKVIRGHRRISMNLRTGGQLLMTMSSRK